MAAKQFASTYGQFAQDLPESRMKGVRKVSVIERLHVGLMQWALAIWSGAGDCCHQQSTVSLISENRIYFVILNLSLVAKDSKNICCSSVLLSCSCLNLTVAVKDCLLWIFCHTTNCTSTTKCISPQCICCYSGHFINCIWCLCTVVYAFHVPVLDTRVYSNDTFANEIWAFCCMCMWFVWAMNGCTVLLLSFKTSHIKIFVISTQLVTLMSLNHSLNICITS